MSKIVKWLLIALLALLLVLGLVFGLRSCQPKETVEPVNEVSEAVKEVEDLINLIPAEIDLSNVEIVDQAKAAFDALDDENKALVKNADKLQHAIDVAELFRSNAADLDAIKGLLGDFKGIDLGSIERPELIKKVLELRNKIDLLDPTVKASIDPADLKVLEDAEVELEKDGDYINEMLKGISFPTMSLNFGEKLKALVENLTPEELEKVDPELISKLNSTVEELQSQKPEAVKEVEELISKINPDITLDSESVIREAEAKFNALSEEDKAKVENSDILRNFINQLDELKAKAASEQPTENQEEAEVQNTEENQNKEEKTEEKENVQTEPKLPATGVE